MRSGQDSPKSSFATIVLVLGMLLLPAAVTLHTVRVSSVVDVSFPNPSPFGYTISLSLFVVPILVIGCWLIPQNGVKLSKKSFTRTVACLFPLGLALEFFFAHRFLRFPNPSATIGIPAPALGPCVADQLSGSGYSANSSPQVHCHTFLGTTDHVIVGSVPVEEYVFYLTGFIVVLLLYIWLDEYWLNAYSVPSTADERKHFQRLLRFHPQSLFLGFVLVAAAIVCRHFYDIHHPGVPGFPGYFTYLVAASLGPSTLLFPAALPVINWRAFSLVLFVVLLTSLLWEASLGVPYGWWDYQHAQMMGIFITAWNSLPIEAVCVWIAVTFQTVIVYEVIRRWQSSGRKARHAFLG